MLVHDKPPQFSQVLSIQVSLKIFGQRLNRRVEITLVVGEDLLLITSVKVESEDVGVHECFPALAQNIHSCLEVLHQTPFETLDIDGSLDFLLMNYTIIIESKAMIGFIIGVTLILS